MFSSDTPLLIRVRDPIDQKTLIGWAYPEEISQQHGLSLWTPMTLEHIVSPRQQVHKCQLMNHVEVWGPSGWHAIHQLYRRTLAPMEFLYRIMGSFGVADLTLDQKVKLDNVNVYKDPFDDNDCNSTNNIVNTDTDLLEIDDLDVGDAVLTKTFLTGFQKVRPFERTEDTLSACKRTLLTLLNDAQVAGYMLRTIESFVEDMSQDERWKVSFEKAKQGPKRVQSIQCLGHSTEFVYSLDVDVPITCSDKRPAHCIGPGTLVIQN